MSDTRIVAGIGFRRGTPADAIVALIRRALGQAGRGETLAVIATAADRAADPAIREAAAAFGLVPLAVEAEALMGADPRVPTRSARIERLRGVGSLAEAAALAIVGDGGHLVLARIDDGQATCALAVMEDAISSAHLLPLPEAGKGERRVSEGRKRGATAPDSVLASPPLLRRVPSPASGGGENARISGEQPDPSLEPERAAAAQIATQIT